MMLPTPKDSTWVHDKVHSNVNIIHKLRQHSVLFNYFTCIRFYSIFNETCIRHLTQNPPPLEERHCQQRGAGRVSRGTQACSLASYCPGPSDCARPITYKYNYSRSTHNCQSIGFQCIARQDQTILVTYGEEDWTLNKARWWKKIRSSWNVALSKNAAGKLDGENDKKSIQTPGTNYQKENGLLWTYLQKQEV